MTNITQLLDTLQNNPITLVFLAAIAATLALLFFFPAILNLVPTTVIAEKTKKTHHRGLFLGSLFIVLVIAGGAILLVPGIRQKIGEIGQKQPEVATKVLTYGTITNVDSENKAVRIKEVLTGKEYEVGVGSQTKIFLGEEEVDFSKILLDWPVTLISDKSLEEGKDNQVAQILVAPVPKGLQPSGVGE